MKPVKFLERLKDTNKKDRDYFVYMLKSISIAVFAAAIISYLFYNSLLAVLFFSPALILFVKNKKKDYEKIKKQKMAKSFKDGLQVIRNALQSGYSLENAFREAVSEIVFLYGKNSCIFREFSEIIRLIDVNVPIEDAFHNFSVKVNVPEIKNFDEVLKYAKKSGGNLSLIIENTSEIIEGKIELNREIETIIHGKKFEQQIMSVVPMLIILYLRVSKLGNIEKLYGNPAGAVIMTVCLFMYMTGMWLASKITDIPV